MGIIDGVYINMAVGSGKGSPKKGVVLLGVCSMGGVQVFRLITRLRDGQGLSDLVNGGVCGTEPGESEDDIFLSTAHDIEEVFLSDPFDVDIEGTSVADCTSLVCGLVNVANSDGGCEFLGGELVFPDKLPVYARDVYSRIYQCRGVNDFESVRRGDQLNRDTHRFIQC